MAARLKAEFPGLELKGEYYTPPAPRPQLAQLAQAIYVATLLLIVSGDSLFNAIGMEVPEVVRSMQQNQMSTMFFVFFIGNNIAQSLMNSGAFEVTYNGNLVWSKLDAGRLPTWPELINQMHSAGLPAMNQY